MHGLGAQAGRMAQSTGAVYAHRVEKPPAKKTSPEPPQAPPETDLVLVVRRCPFCHETVSGSLDVAVCAACDARHHLACWDEHERGSCSSCGGTARLVLESQQDRESSSRPWRLVSLGVAVLMALGMGWFVSLQRHAETRELELPAIPEDPMADQRRYAMIDYSQRLKEWEHDATPAERAEALAARLWAIPGIRGVDSAEGLEVTEVRPGSPAERAGVAAGDVLRELRRHTPSVHSVSINRVNMLDRAVLKYLGHDLESDWSIRLVRDGTLTDLPYAR